LSLQTAEQLKTAAKQVESNAKVAKSQGKNQVASLLIEKAELMSDKATLMSDKAKLLDQQDFMTKQRDSLLQQENSKLDGAVQASLMETQTKVIDLKKQLQEKKQAESLLKQAMADKEMYEKLTTKYEKEWANAIKMLVKLQNEIKAVGRMEDDLNKVVGWFSRHYGCELGVQVNRLA